MPQILLIDDEKPVRSAIAEILTMYGYTVIEANSGNEGVRLYNMNPIDLVITDVLMPDKDGLELILEFQQNSPEAKIIAISGGGVIGGSSYLEVAENFGAQAVLSKPFTAEELVNMVKKVLEN